jgi:hypothetical protein
MRAGVKLNGSCSAPNAGTVTPVTRFMIRANTPSAS